MNKSMLSAITLAALALAACAKEEKSSPAAPETTIAADPAAPTAESDLEARSADVYAVPASADLSAVRTKEDLAIAADAAFEQADFDADGTLSLTEFYNLAAILTPVAAVEDISETDQASIDPISGEAISETADPAMTDEAAADTSALDARFAALSGSDGLLTPDELRAALAVQFDAADQDFDAALNDDESQAFLAATIF